MQNNFLGVKSQGEKVAIWKRVDISIREGNGTPLQYSCLENPMDGGAWWPAVHEVAEGRTRLSDFTFAFHFHALEKEMAPHSSTLAWRILGTGEPGGLPSMGSHRVGHDWSDLALISLVQFICHSLHHIILIFYTASQLNYCSASLPQHQKFLC